MSLGENSISLRGKPGKELSNRGNEPVNGIVAHEWKVGQIFSCRMLRSQSPFTILRLPFLSMNAERRALCR